MKRNFNISDEMIARYIDGTASKTEIELILSAIAEDDELAETLQLLTEAAPETEMTALRPRFIPISRLAAANDTNTCSWDCELAILKRRNISVDSSSLLQVAKLNNWLRTAGTPLHNVGRIIESQGINVVRKYDATIADITNALRAHDDVIAVVDRNIIYGIVNAAAPAYHAIIIHDIEGNIVSYRDFDSQDTTCTDINIDTFNIAWAASHNYIVTAPLNSVYDPHPIDVADIPLPTELEDLIEAIAENAHDVWARARLDEGWHYGQRRDDTKKTHPDLVEYFRLPDGEKNYDRIMAMNTLRLIQSMGFEISDCRNGTICPDCGSFNRPNFNYCPCCGKKMK